VAQALNLSILCDFMSSLKACMVSIMRMVFSSEMFCVRKTSAPRRIGTLTREVFLKIGSRSSCSVMVIIKSLTALDPMSMAAYFFCSIKPFLFLVRVFLHSNHKVQTASVPEVYCCDDRHYPV